MGRVGSWQGRLEKLVNPPRVCQSIHGVEPALRTCYSFTVLSRALSKTMALLSRLTVLLLLGSILTKAAGEEEPWQCTSSTSCTADDLCNTHLSTQQSTCSCNRHCAHHLC